MVLKADDELRHPSTDLPEWRESMWWCFDMPEYEMGGAIYYAYTPNTPQPVAKLIVYLTKGWVTERNAILYSFEREFPIPQDEWDHLRVGSVASFKRLEPLKKWAIAFDDGERLKMNLNIELFAGNWHWIDNWYETPKFLAGDRYHRPYAATGEMMLDGKTYPLKLTGDSDHSWGPRRWGPLYKSKYVAAQCGRDWAVSFIEIVDGAGAVRPYGFVYDGKRMSAISTLEIIGDYAADGQHRAVSMNIVDEEKRLTRVDAQCFASSPTAYGDVKNNDAYAIFDVNRGQHRGSGILSFFYNKDFYDAVMLRPGAGG